MVILEEMATKIIKQQELVIGPLAWSEAGKVQGLTVDQSHTQVTITNSDQKATIDLLVAQYERLFGRASHDVCRTAVLSLLSSLAPGDIPTSLRA